MEKTIVTAFGRVVSTKPVLEQKSDLPARVLDKLLGLIYYGIVFLSSRGAIFGMFQPVGPAFCAVFLYRGLSLYLAAGATVLGIFFGKVHIYFLRYASTAILMCVAEWVLSKKAKRPPLRWQKAAIAGCASVLGGLVFAAFAHMSIFYGAAAVMEGAMVFGLAFVFDKGAETALQIGNRKILTQEEMMCLAVVAAFLCAALAGVSVPGVSMLMYAATFGILTAGWRGGAGLGTAAGVLFGLVLLISDAGGLALFCLFALWGLAAGIFAELGKSVVFLAVCAVLLLLGFYLDLSLLARPFLWGVLLGGGTFLLLPKKAFACLNTYACYEEDFLTDTLTERKREISSKRILGYGESFQALSKVFFRKQDAEEGRKKELERLIDQIGDGVCKRCSVFSHCWERNFYHTYQNFQNTLRSCEKKGEILESQLPAFFKSCNHKPSIVAAANKGYGAIQSGKLWTAYLDELREMMGTQLECVGTLLKELSREVDKELLPLVELERELCAELEKEGYPAAVSLFGSELGEYRGEIHVKPQGDKKTFLAVAAPLANRVTGHNISITEKTLEKKSTWGFTLREKRRFGLCVGVAADQMEEKAPSGDNYSYLETENGMAVMALADGMGSGRRAERESRTAIELLEQFMELNFPRELAVKLINSVLIAKGPEETFSTLDICSVNLLNGAGEFTKAGAASAYLWRKETVTAIRSHSLPVGVFKNMEPEKTEILLKAGDMVIMVTDGVGDLLDQRGGEAWLLDKFQQFRSHNPQDIADYILKEAAKEAGEKMKDDRTVFVGRLWER